MHKRLFLALPLPQSTQAVLEAYCKSLQLSNVRLIPSNNIHITLLFLGKVDEALLSGLQALFRELYVQNSLFVLKFKKITFAPPQGLVRMVWAEFFSNDAYQNLVSITKESVMRFFELNSCEFKNDEREVIPHATLVRCDRSFIPSSAPLSSIDIPDLIVDQVQLVESTLDSLGSQYTVREVFKLG